MIGMETFNLALDTPRTQFQSQVQRTPLFFPVFLRAIGLHKCSTSSVFVCVIYHLMCFNLLFLGIFSCIYASWGNFFYPLKRGWVGGWVDGVAGIQTPPTDDVDKRFTITFLRRRVRFLNR